MKTEISFKNLYKICFFTLLLSVVLTALAYNILPHFSNAVSASKECYWRSDDIFAYFKCGQNVPFGEIISFVLNWLQLPAVLLIIPVFIIFLPPILWPFILFFYFFAVLYVFAKIRKRIWGEPLPKEDETYYQYLRGLFIASLIIALFFQALLTKNILLIQCIGKAKLGISDGAFKNDKDYRAAMWAAISRDELPIVRLLFQKDYTENPLFLEGAISHKNYEITNFYLDNGVTVRQKALEIISRKVMEGKRCDDTQNENYDILKILLGKIDKPEGELLRNTAISLCVPFMQELLKAGGDPNYKTQKNETLSDWVRKSKVSESNAFNGWLYGKPREEIENRRAQMLGLISKFQILEKEKKLKADKVPFPEPDSP
jgi:hypothetical protein